MPKQSGFFVNVKYFIPIDKKDFGKQAAAYATMDAIQKTGALPEGFDGKVVSVAVKAGGYDDAETPVEPAPEGDNPDKISGSDAPAGDAVAETPRRRAERTA